MGAHLHVAVWLLGSLSRVARKALGLVTRWRVGGR